MGYVSLWLFRRILMRLFTLSIISVLFLFQAGFCQSKQETIEWINTSGIEYLKEIAGNSSLHWDLDEYGSFRITDYNPKYNNGSEKEIARRYTYLNLYELDPKETAIKQDSSDVNTYRLLLRCREKRGFCIKTRNDFEDSSLKTSESADFPIMLKNDFDKAKGTKLSEVLSYAVRLFNGKSTSVE
ncbi:hypothetical protein [Halalkalibaculum sp. DA384]|uniref:hypothetical protein n=1 Tax=Halalkalibaculum sp. DA384 TaxID=3373606 RepID=UPI003754A30B